MPIDGATHSVSWIACEYGEDRNGSGPVYHPVVKMVSWVVCGENDGKKDSPFLDCVKLVAFHDDVVLDHIEFAATTYPVVNCVTGNRVRCLVHTGSDRTSSGTRQARLRRLVDGGFWGRQGCGVGWTRMADGRDKQPSGTGDIEGRRLWCECIG